MAEQSPDGRDRSADLTRAEGARHIGQENSVADQLSINETPNFGRR